MGKRSEEDKGGRRVEIGVRRRQEEGQRREEGRGNDT